MAELHGLRVLTTDQINTIHAIKSPPNPSAFPNREAYAKAYEQWWRDMHCWTITNIGEGQ